MTTQDASTPIDETCLNDFIGRALNDMGALASAPLIRIGDRLGIYEAMADGTPVTPSELATRTHLAERYLREWLLNQAAGGYIEYDATSERYRLPAEHAAALPALYGGFQLLLAALQAEPRIAEAFRTGEGMEWGEHHHELFEGCERFFRPGYAQHLVTSWIPSLDGVEERLRSGTEVADVGCGHGASTILMALAYPDSTFTGYDNHEGSIVAARQAAEEAGVSSRVRFEVADASDYPAPVSGFGLITFFDCLHDMGDPVSAINRAAGALASDGVAMIVEPMAGEHVEDNLNPVSRVFAGASTLLCTPHSLASGGPALGAQASEARLAEVARQGGLTRFRRAAETPFNRVFEARR